MRSVEQARVRQARHRARYANDPVFQARVKAYAIRWAKEHPRNVRHNSLMSKYNLTFEQVETMIEAQAGLCGICCEPMKPGRDTNVDHDHATGRVRGLLCRVCNTRLGRIEADPLLTQASLSYAEAA